MKEQNTKLMKEAKKLMFFSIGLALLTSITFMPMSHPEINHDLRLYMCVILQVIGCVICLVQIRKTLRLLGEQ